MSTLVSINNYYYERGGSEAVFFGHNRMLEAQGWNVVPFSMKHPRNIPSPWSDYFVDELEMSGQYSMAQKLVRLPKVIYSLEARTKLSRLLDRVRPDVAHGHNIYHHISPSILGLLKSRGIPTLLTLHDLKIACPAYSMMAPDGICERCKGGRVYNVVAHRCIGNSAAMSFIVMLEAVVHRLIGSYRDCVSRFIVPSRFYIDKFSEWGLPRSQFRYVPNFVHAPGFQPNPTPGKAFIYFGRLTPQKGVATLIRAVAEARTPLVVAGTGPDMEAMQALTASLGADVSFLGHLSGSMLHDTIRAARAVVLPSEWYENAPMSLLEGYALGKPVIGARIGGIPELVREGETGVCFESGNVASLVAALRDMASRPDDELTQMGQSGRRWVEQDFTLDRYRQRILAAYRELGIRIDSIPSTDTLRLESFASGEGE
ncbi:MAG TPA: glycosyltransferase family 4 protein [Steroidobacteraceae bacterium]|nr:glycosyltransferase family 4 protein [Steroidobacteraceae bacterium]